DRVVPELRLEQGVVGGVVADVDRHEQRGNAEDERQGQQRPVRERVDQNERVRPDDQGPEHQGLDKDRAVRQPALAGPPEVVVDSLLHRSVEAVAGLVLEPDRVHSPPPRCRFPETCLHISPPGQPAVSRRPSPSGAATRSASRPTCVSRKANRTTANGAKTQNRSRVCGPASGHTRSSSQWTATTTPIATAAHRITTTRLISPATRFL